MRFQIISPFRCRLFRSVVQQSFSTASTTKSEPDSEYIDPDDPNYSAVPQYPEDAPSVFDRSTNYTNYSSDYMKTWLPQERKILANIVKQIPTVPDKINFVNPYERPWSLVERHKHRLWHRHLKSPRRAYYLTPVPNGYNSLNFYKFVTQTHCIRGTPDLYANVNVTPEQLTVFKEALMETFDIELKGRKNVEQVVDYVIHQIPNICVSLFSHEFEHLKDTQIGLDVRYESFVERGGFEELYYKLKSRKEIEEERTKKLKELKGAQTDDNENLPEIQINEKKDKKSNVRVLGDNVYKLGELAFCFRDKANAQFRHKLPLPEFVDINDELCYTDVPTCIYSPLSFNALPDSDPLYMIPGFEYGDQHEFGSLLLNSFKNIKSQLQRWDAEDAEFEECLLSLGINCCFSWLSGQGHYLGFNNLNDLEFPLTTQAVFTDGQMWYFVAYQLNTFDLKVNFDPEKRPKCNLCWYEGPLKLFDINDKGEFENINEKVVEKLLKFLFLRPSVRTNVLEMKPYVEKPLEKVVTDADKLKAMVETVSDVVYELPK